MHSSPRLASWCPPHGSTCTDRTGAAAKGLKNKYIKYIDIFVYLYMYMSWHMTQWVLSMSAIQMAGMLGCLLTTSLSIIDVSTYVVCMRMGQPSRRVFTIFGSRSAKPEPCTLRPPPIYIECRPTWCITSERMLFVYQFLAAGSHWCRTIR